MKPDRDREHAQEVSSPGQPSDSQSAQTWPVCSTHLEGLSDMVKVQGAVRQTYLTESGKRAMGFRSSDLSCESCNYAIPT